MVSGAEQLADLLDRLRRGDVIKYEASGGGREGPVTVRVSDIGEWEGTYCIFGEGKQGGEYAVFPDGRPSGQKYDPPEACYIRASREDPLSNMELYTHGTLQWIRVDRKVMDRFRDS